MAKAHARAKPQLSAGLKTRALLEGAKGEEPRWHPVLVLRGPRSCQVETGAAQKPVSYQLVRCRVPNSTEPLDVAIERFEGYCEEE